MLTAIKRCIRRTIIGVGACLTGRRVPEAHWKQVPDSELPLRSSDESDYSDDSLHKIKLKRHAYHSSRRKGERNRSRLCLALLIFIVFLSGGLIFLLASPKFPEYFPQYYPKAEPQRLASKISPEDTPAIIYPPIGEDRSLKVAPYNEARKDSPPTPLFIAFTRNNLMIEQALTSLIAAGWPREDIYIIDNTGTMDANPKRHLSPSNPFFLDYHLLRTRYGVTVLRTPTLLTFAQLQNFMIATAQANRWPTYFWSHSDIAVLSDEGARPYTSVYQRVVQDMAEWTDRHGNGKELSWAVRFYAYDWLTLVNTEAMQKVGAWDVFIPYYITDCDFYDRIEMAGLTKTESRVLNGMVFDLAETVPRFESRFFPDEGEEPHPGSRRFHALRKELAELAKKKISRPDGNRNTWQGAQGGGKGEAWTYDPKGFQKAWWMMSDMGKKVYREKWGMKDCGVYEKGKRIGDMWKGANEETRGWGFLSSIF